MQNPSIKEIVEELDAEVLVGKENLSNLTGKFAVGAMQLPNFLNHIDQNSLVITPGDRADIILGSLQAHISSKYPSVAGIVLTGGIKPEETIMRLIEGTQQNVPIVSVKTGTFETTQKIGAIRSDVSKEKITKIQSALDTFGKFVSPENFIESMNSYTNKVVTPMMFQYSLIDTAKKARKKSFYQNLAIQEF